MSHFNLAQFAVFMVGLAVGLFGMAVTTRVFNLGRENFRKQRIASMAGLAVVIGGAVFYAAHSLLPGLVTPTAGVYLLVTLVFGGLGILDDVRGDRSVGGFRGHIGALRQGKVTTGLAKMLGGSAAALAAGFLLHHTSPWRAVLTALVIALTANTLNLLDLRPGRCLFGFSLGALAVIAGHVAGGQLFFFAVAVAIVLYPLDARGFVMLGDTGSNAFGAILGVALSTTFGWPVQLALVACMAGFQIWCERNSWSRTIEGNAVLRAIDVRIGVR